MAGYSHKTWACPFFGWDEKLAVHGECGRIVFKDRKAANRYMDCHCADISGWKGCSMSQSLMEYYERTE